MRKTNNKPIGVFDSGIGGLTIAKEIIKRLPNESIVYLGDTARVPYGSRPKEVIVGFAGELADFLLKRGVKCLVAACNTISAVALGEIEKVSPVPVIGVVNPAVKKAVLKTKNKKIGVIGTQGTIQSRAYELAIRNMDSGIKVFSAGCPLFVPLIEEGLHRHEATRLVAEDYLKEIISSNVDTLILGCTHYPLLYETIAKTVGPKVTLVDSAGPTTEELIALLRQNHLLAVQNNPTYEFFVTDAPERVYRVAGRFFGEALNGNLKRVTLPTP